MIANSSEDTAAADHTHGLRSAQARSVHRRLPVGAEVLPGEGVHFRVWAPRAREVAVEWSGPDGQARSTPLRSEQNGYFSGVEAQARAGTLYQYQLGHGAFPDPASRFQPEGTHGPSQVIDPAGFHWSDDRWRGVKVESQILYELHVGTFTPEGTWDAAAKEIPRLAELGITIIEVMPVAEFPGRFGWGYDGVDLFAPTRLYGGPDDFRRFVDAAHGRGIGVILDVVYNHLGPDGNYLKEFAEAYFTDRYKNEWGQAINFDGEESSPVREFFLANASYWIDEYHLDGLRLDATQQIFDSSREHILTAITRAVRQAAKGRKTYIVAENECQHTRLVRSTEGGGYGMDALWNDDFHHSATVALTGRAEAYYSDHRGTPQEFISAAKWGYLFQGQHYRWQKKRRGTRALDLPPWSFVNFLQNHDQVANSLRGERMTELASPATVRAMTALLFLMPGSVMLFQGQEFAASTPFLYFADHNPELAGFVAKGREEFLSQFPTIACVKSGSLLAAPESEQTFHRSKLRLVEREEHSEVYQLHRDLIRLRQTDPVFRHPRPGGLDGAVLGPDAFVLRYFGSNGWEDRLLVVNLGLDLRLASVPEPLLAPLEGYVWRNHWSSEDSRYGGLGTPPLETEDGWWIPGRASVVLTQVEISQVGHGENHSNHPPGQG